MTVAVTYAGASGRLLSVVGEVLTVLGDRPLAPGTPMVFDAGDHTIEGRTIGSRKLAAAFEIRVRLVNLSRERRAWLVATIEGATPPTS